MKRTTLFVVCALILASCSTTPIGNLRPPGCEASAIYDRVPYPNILSTIEIVAVMDAVAKYPELKPYLVKFSKDMVSLLETNETLTYVDLARLASNQVSWSNKYVGILVLSLPELVASFNQPVLIHDCDRTFLLSHFKRQLQALGG
jgi:hypothetical protein